MKKLVSEEELVKGAERKRIRQGKMWSLIMRILRISRLNALYDKHYSADPQVFIDRVMSALEVELVVNEDELANIPKDGAFITVSNHPYGGLDGIVLMKLVGSQRPDYKIWANFVLQRVEPLQDFILPINPFNASLSDTSNISGLRATMTHLQDGHPIGMFPAGEVSSLHSGHITDKKWNSGALKLVQRAEVPIVPIYFKGRNSALFHILGLISPLLRTVKLPSELLNKQARRIEVRIGKPISVKDQKQFADVNQLGRYIRTKTYALGLPLEVKKFFKNRMKRMVTPEPIQPPQSDVDILNEINALGTDAHLFDSGDFALYCASSDQIPITLQEIGRLRELTYREVGEGTNYACDLDEFDLYYQHLIIWDKVHHKIVGGYRIGKGSDIMWRYGVRGLYIHQLFKLKTATFPILKESLELGRSYIVKEYQRKPLPLFLLWKGILVYLLKHPECRYLIGPVSISDKFSGFSKGILIEFLKRNFYDDVVAKHIKPRKKFKPSVQDIDIDILLESSQHDLAKLDRIIQDVEPNNLNIPVLFKKYLKQNAKIIGFNLDPKFNNALDGLMLLDIYDVPANTITSLMNELDDEELNEALHSRNLVA